MPHLFDPIAFRSLTLSNRIVVSPMCEYSSVDGFSNDWHLVHLGSRAVGGASLVMTEATAVSAVGRISPHDLGIYDDGHVPGLARIVRFIHTQKTLAGIQLAHAGRKGSTARPWDGGGRVGREHGGWEPVGPTAEPFADNYPIPCPLSVAEVEAIVAAFRTAARRALAAGFDAVEIHAAHGYLIHEFLSPLVNTRRDEYGGPFDNRARFCLEVVDAVRGVWPDRLPLFVRISATDWKEGGWDVDQAIELARLLKDHGVDLVDCSSGGAVVDQQIALGPGYQVPFAERIRREAGIATGAVGLITEAEQAETIVAAGQADVILIARQLLRDPYWPLHAADSLGVTVPWPPQYLRAAQRTTPPR
ncbi:MAG TPA: NADH:flavin oxidoreductase/NADH oxidase [Vicinamibacterales bacterium]|nr:NADH:flavin oxidoreductase/NADH oxidase [Vicinamibacterales bacterium]